MACVTLSDTMTESGHLTLSIRADGGLIYLAATYDDALRALIKTLPRRRWDRDLQGRPPARPPAPAFAACRAALG